MFKLKLLDLVDRAGATFAQAFLASITVDATGITQVDAAKVAAVAGLYSVAKYALTELNAYLRAAKAAPPPPEPVPVPEAPAPATA